MRWLFICMLPPVWVIAQTDTSLAQKQRPPRTIKTNLLELLSPFQQSVTAQTDWPLGRRWGLELGAGAVLDSRVHAPLTGDTYSGFRLRTGLKYYYSLTETRNFYVGLALKGSWVQNNRYVSLIRQGGQYTEIAKRQRQLNTLGAALYTGTQQYIGSRKRFFIEPFAGLGVRQQHITPYYLPPDAVQFNPRRVFINWQKDPGTYILPDLLLGFYLGWRF